jgi:phospho-N-acetylmuramoyl-pentapeptide-transferase
MIIFVMWCWVWLDLSMITSRLSKKTNPGCTAGSRLADRSLSGLVLGATLYFWPAFQEFNTLSTVPFLKEVNIDYAFFGEQLGWLIYIPLVIFVITAVSNSANLTDGLDGLLSGTSAIAGTILGIFAYVSGRVDFSNFLNIMYLPGSGELTIFAASLVGGLPWFLWYNTHPASVFMGDTGITRIGGALVPSP